MCTELILAVLYFLAIFFANFFLIQIIKNILKEIFYFLKIEQIFKNIQKKEKLNLYFFFLFLKKNLYSFSNLNFLNQHIHTKDLLIHGYTYKYLLIHFKEKPKQIIPKILLFNQIYLSLLIQQYLNSFETKEE
jgi:hypothetical protein